MPSLSSLPVSAHYPSTFKYFLSVCVCTFQAEQIKKTKTILRVYRCDNEGVCRRLSTAKNAGRQLSMRIFCGAGFYKRREKKIQRKEKNVPSPGDR